jgi:signal transduction histidine kinase
MGVAIPVMHYTAMAAASFTPSGMPADLSHAVSISALGTAGIVAVTFLVLGLALLTSSVDRRFAAHTLELQEEKLHRSEAYLAEAQRLSHTGSVGWRASTGEILWSEETFRIFQYDRTTIPTVELVLQRVYFDNEYRLLMPDDSVRYVHVVAHALSDESGGIEFVGAVTDTTESRRAEEALRRSESYLAEAQRLTHTGSWAWRVAGGDALHISEEWYRIFGFDPDVGMPGWEERLQRLHPEDRAKWQRAVDRAIGEKSDYEVKDLPQVMGGRVQLQQVFMNLMLNGIDAMKDVDAAAELTIKSQQAEKGELLISVSDTGVGLPSQQADQIFNAFFSTKPHGTGMGLRISRSIIESHGGRLWAADNSPHGASFCFTLPTKAETKE